MPLLSFYSYPPLYVFIFILYFQDLDDEERSVIIPKTSNASIGLHKIDFDISMDDLYVRQGIEDGTLRIPPLPFGHFNLMIGY